VSMNLKTIHAELPESLFLRVSKSFVVNYSHITAIESDAVSVGAASVPLGDAFRASFLDFMQKKGLLKP
jgi:DNA-binding LytR/AlgR family response regulator